MAMAPSRRGVCSIDQGRCVCPGAICTVQHNAYLRVLRPRIRCDDATRTFSDVQLLFALPALARINIFLCFALVCLMPINSTSAR